MPPKLAGALRLVASACIEAPNHAVWSLLAALEEIPAWSEMVTDARCEGQVSRGVGAERTCDLRGGVTIRERWVAWDEGHSFTYEGEGIPLVVRARNRWAVQPVGEHTLLTSEAEVVLKGGRLGRLLEPLFAVQARRMANRSLVAFKYIVEHGEPPRVRHAKLPRVSAAC